MTQGSVGKKLQTIVVVLTVFLVLNEAIYAISRVLPATSAFDSTASFCIFDPTGAGGGGSVRFVDSLPADCPASKLIETSSTKHLCVSRASHGSEQHILQKRYDLDYDCMS